MRTNLVIGPLFASLLLAAPPALAQEARDAAVASQAPLGAGQVALPALPPQPGASTFIPPVATNGQSYPPEYQRARVEWVEECSRRYLSDRHKGNGGILGGLLGAVVGGVAGNRIDNHGSRLAGTLIGAGAGGVVGAVVGSAIDRSNRSKAEVEALDWCEDYLARNTVSAPAYGAPYPYPPMAYQQTPYAMGYAYGPPVMMQPVMVPVQRCHEHVVVERPVYRTVTVRKVIHDKRVRMQPAKTVK
jgi:Glycine zipper 2TM domain